MKIATFSVNGINGRLSVLLRWLEEAQPDVVCLQELKAPQEKFPKAALAAAGYGEIWQGQKSWNGVAVLARGETPIETRRGLPGNVDDTQSRYLEAAVKGKHSNRYSPGMDRRGPRPASGREDLHVLGLLPECLRSRCRTPRRPSSPGPDDQEPPPRCRREAPCSRLGKGK